MKSHSERDTALWARVEELLRFRETLRKDTGAGNPYLQSVRIEEVESILYDGLVPQARSIVLGLARGRMPEDRLKEITNEAIHRMFNAYANFKGNSSLKTYFASIVRNLTVDQIKKMSKERHIFTQTDEDLARAVDARAVEAFEEDTRAARREDVVPGFEDIFELIDWQAQNLTDKEFVAVVLKLAALRMKKKMTDEELACKLGLKRSTFLDTFKRGRDKIYLYWKEKSSQ